MTLDFDTLAIPNASLAHLKYKVSEVLSKDGADIRRVEENTFQHTINPGSASPGFIEINVKKATPARLRYDHRPMQRFASYHEKELNSLDVEWKEAGGMMWTDSLQVNLPRGPFSGDIRWEVHFFGEREPVYLSGNAFNSPTGFSYGLSNGELKNAHAAFGKVKMELASVIERFTFKKQADGKSSYQKLPSGQPIKVMFNQNEVTLDAGKADVIQLMAFDAQGLRLRKDGYTVTNGSRKKMYFWGVPARFVIDVATEKINKTIAFNVRQRTVDENRYIKFKQDIANHRDIVRTLKQIASAQRKDRTKYGDDIAGLFYLYGLKQKKPMALIEKKVAHSDPAGQRRFGYTLKRYKGYYFTLLSGVESDGTQNDYLRLPKQRSYTWKKGSFKTKPFLQPPDLVAIPKDGTQPTFFMQFDQVFMKQLNGDKLTYLPEDYYSTGWVEARFVEG
jgi:hypothetical protein